MSMMENCTWLLGCACYQFLERSLHLIPSGVEGFFEVACRKISFFNTRMVENINVDEFRNERYVDRVSLVNHNGV